MTEYQYFIFDNTYSTNPQGLKLGVSITKIPIHFNMKFEECEGPYNSLRAIRRNSLIYKRLLYTNPRKANKIFENQHIIEVGNYFPIPHGSTFHPDVINIFSHATKGRRLNKNLSGLHFFDPSKIRIKTLLETDSKTGVFKAEFEYYDSETKKWLEKRTPSTFFPKNWDFTRLLMECQYAHDQLEGNFPDNGIIQSRTSNSILVEFFFKKGKPVSFYPKIEQ